MVKHGVVCGIPLPITREVIPVPTEYKYTTECHFTNPGKKATQRFESGARISGSVLVILSAIRTEERDLAPSLTSEPNEVDYFCVAKGVRKSFLKQGKMVPGALDHFINDRVSN